MKKKIALYLFILGTFSMTAQEIQWETNVRNAVKISKEQNKPLMLFFTGSDWCGWCVRLQKEVFKTKDFEEWAKKNVIAVELDFPARKEQPNEIKQQNNQLQQVFGVQGYPMVLFANVIESNNKVNFSVLGRIGYVAGGSKVWLSEADKFFKKK